MTTLLTKNILSKAALVLVLGLLIAFVWRAGGFGLSTQKETVTIPQGSRSASGDGDSTAAVASDGASGAQPAVRDLEIVTLLPFDAIPAIFNPTFITAEEAEMYFNPTERVLGVSINGDHRAYSVPMLSRHEIVNDTVGGQKIAITW